MKFLVKNYPLNGKCVFMEKTTILLFYIIKISIFKNWIEILKSRSKIIIQKFSLLTKCTFTSLYPPRTNNISKSNFFEC